MKPDAIRVTPLVPPQRGVQMALAYTLVRDAAEGRPPHVWVPRLSEEKELLAASSALLTYGCVANLDMTEDSIPNRLALVKLEQ